jgi:hypothetical protein
LHAWPRFEAPHCTSTHFHFTNDLLGAIIGPRNGWIVVESAEAWPILTQWDEQIPQLFDRSE